MSPTPAPSQVIQPPAAPPIILDYGHAKPKPWGDRVALLVSALATGAIGLVVAVVLVELEIENWPSFGMALAAVPIGCIAAAFLLIAGTAVKAAIYDAGRPRRGSVDSNSPTE